MNKGASVVAVFAVGARDMGVIRPPRVAIYGRAVAVLNFRKRFVDSLIGGTRTPRDHVTRQLKYECRISFATHLTSSYHPLPPTSTNYQTL